MSMRVHGRTWVLCTAAHGEVRGPGYEEDHGLVHRLVHGTGHGQLPMALMSWSMGRPMDHTGQVGGQPIKVYGPVHTKCS